MRIAILAFPRVQLLDVAGPADVFAEAARQLGRPAAYQVQVIGTGAGLLRSSNGLRLAVDATVATQRGRIDTLLVAGSPDIEDMAGDPALHDWLRRQSAPCGAMARSAAAPSCWRPPGCSMASGWRPTGTPRPGWRRPARWRSVEPDAIYVKDGKLFTSAGVTAGMDLALAMVEEDHGRELALRVARELVMFLKRPGGQSQFSAHLAAQTAERSQRARGAGSMCWRT